MPEYALGSFLSRWLAGTRHELAASESKTWPLAALLGMADDADRARWEGLGLGYTDPCGAAWLRARICADYVGVDAEGIIGFAGAQEALQIALRVLAGAGDHAILVLPCYQPSELALIGLCETTGVALDSNEGWALDLDRVAAAIRPNTKLVLVNFPNNPTGKLIPPAAFEALIALCRRHGLWLVNDEVYRLIDRDPSQRLPCVADAYERGVSVDAMSKSYGLPGLRVGWIACRDAGLVRQATGLKQMASLYLAAPSEVLAHVALGRREQLLARNRRIACDNLGVLDRFLETHAESFSWHRPDGGVTGYVHYHGNDGVEAFCARLALEAGTLVLPASVWRSSLCSLPTEYFRIGFGRLGTAEAIKTIASALHRRAA